MSDISRRPIAPDLSAPATQIVRNRADYLGEGQDDIGQRIAEDRLELFVTSDPTQAIQQEFAIHAPDFIVLHDIGASSSLRLLTAIAKALAAPLQQLAIRRQGLGMALATLRFVQVPGPGKTHLRLYTSDVDADSQSRRQLANVLLANSRLGVLMVGDLPSHALTSALQPVRDAIRAGPWANRNLLLMPMGSSTALAAQAETLASGREITVRVTPTAARPNDAWNYISGAWNQLRGQTGGVAPTGNGSAPAAPTPQNKTVVAPPTAPTAPRTPAPRGDAADDSGLMPLVDSDPRWKAYLSQCSAIKGLISACVFDFRAERALAHVGSRPGPDRLVAQGAALFAAMAESSRALGLGHAQPDASITLTGHHLLLHPLPGHPGIVLHAVLDASSANLPLARMQLQRVDMTLRDAAQAPARS